MTIAAKSVSRLKLFVDPLTIRSKEIHIAMDATFLCKGCGLQLQSISKVKDGDINEPCGQLVDNTPRLRCILCG